MKKLSLCLILILNYSLFAKDKTTKESIDYEGFLKLTKEVEPYRNKRKVDIHIFNKMSQDKNTIILDTRSKSAYDSVHIKGAIHLNFSDFTEGKLAKVIPNKNFHIICL